MKGGHKPIHIMRRAPADVVNDPVIKLQLARGDRDSVLFYLLFMDWSFIEGGDLPADPEALAAVMGFPEKLVRRVLPIWVEAGKLKIEDTCVFNPRVRAEVHDELIFREEQRQRGAEGGRASARKRSVKRTVDQAPDQTVEGASSPPAPSPAPAPAPAPTPQTPRAGLVPPTMPEGGLDPVKCPACGALGSIRRSRSTDGTWYCSTREDGCGKTFAEDDPTILRQQPKRVRDSILGPEKPLQLARQPELPADQADLVGRRVELAEEFCLWFAQQDPEERQSDAYLRWLTLKGIPFPSVAQVSIGDAIRDRNRKAVAS